VGLPTPVSRTGVRIVAVAVLSSFLSVTAPLAAAAPVAPVAPGTVVLDWNTVLVDALLRQRPANNNTPTPPPESPRLAATVQGAVFDAVNGVERRFTPLRVTRTAPPGASAEAAAVGAAYTTITGLGLPCDDTCFEAARNESLAKLKLAVDPPAVDAGARWGDEVAKEFLA
jgi:hypothetical protein